MGHRPPDMRYRQQDHLKHLDRSWRATAAPRAADSAPLALPPGERPTTIRLLLAATTVLGLACLAATGVSTAEAAFPGLNGRIACEANRGEFGIPSPNPTAISRAEIISINPDGTGETLLTNNRTRDGDAAFSPDGTKIAFEARRVEGQPDNSEIYVANNDGDLEGPDVRRLTFNNGELTGGTRNQVAATDRNPSWSPDGTRIVFHSGRETTFSDGAPTPARDFEIYSMDAVTGEQGDLQRLTNVRGQDAAPNWSPDGSKIAFQSLRENAAGQTQNLEVFTMNPDGSDVTNVSNSPGTPDSPATREINENTDALDSAPQFSPDGQQIVFSSTRSGVTPGNQNFEIFKMSRDGSGQVRLTSNLTGDTPETEGDFDNTPTFSPDGRRILFTSGRTSTGPPPAGDDLVVYSMDSSAGEAAGLQRLVQTGVQFGKCDWQALPRPAAQPPTPTTPAAPVEPASFEDCPASSANVIRGEASANTITGTPGGDRIFGGTGNDVVDALAGNDCVDTGTGDDRGQGGLGNDLMLAGTGDDRMSGSSGRDRLRGNPGNDRLDGGRGNDSIFGDAGNDKLLGGFGNDRLHGVSGKDVISGSRGRDRINGGSANDRISGGSSGDRIAGDAGHDRINGNSGSDSISGNSGNDRIASRDGARDRVNCGLGRDSVVADRKDRVSRNCERVRRR